MAILVSLFLFASLGLIRIATASNSGLDSHQWHQLGLTSGLLGDFGVALMVSLLGSLNIVKRQGPGRWTWITITLGAWILTTANFIYASHFQMPIRLWVMTGMGENTWSIRNLIFEMILNPWVITSIALLCGYLRIFPTGFAKQESLSKTRRALAHSTTALGVVVLFQAPIWLQVPSPTESSLSVQIHRLWFDDLSTGSWRALKGRNQAAMPTSEALNTLGLYSEIWKSGPLKGQGIKFNLDQKWTKKKWNVVVLLIESGRSFEMLDPELKREVFPNLSKTLSERGLFFNQAFSAANYTVQGQFSTYCSHLNRFDGPPVYQSRPHIPITCIQGLLKELGYETAMMTPFHKFFSGKYVFEVNHGTNTFFDREHYTPTTEEEISRTSEWGVDDATFLKKAFVDLEQLHSKGKPFFAHLLTTGTHAPYRAVPGFGPSDVLQKRFEGAGNYLNYISAMKATDHAMGSFLRQFFTSKMASDTLLVVAGDHGASIYPGIRELAGVTRDLLWSRILFGVFVPGQKIGRTINYPVNQIDIAPMIASILGINPHPAWLGRNPLEGSGSPWVKKTGMYGITYRTPERYCSTELDSETIKCLRMKKSSDPFFTRPEVIPEDPEQTRLLRQVIQASDSLLGSLGLEGPNS